MTNMKTILHSSTKRLVCFYHKNCLDGSFSGALMRLIFENTGKDFIMVATNYGDDLLPLVKPGDFVFFVDMSVKPIALKVMAKKVVGIVVLDHHDTAVRMYEAVTETYFNDLDVTLCFDQTRCGAKLVYDSFKDTALTHGLNFRDYSDVITLINDLDLQTPNAELPAQRAFGAYAKTYLDDLSKVYDFLKYYSKNTLDIDQEIATIGGVMVDVEDSQVNWAIDNTLRVITLEVPGGECVRDVALVNAPKYLCTRISRVLEDKYTCVMIYHDSPVGRTYRIASIRGGLVVNAIAESFGGGGHPHSAGIVASKNSYLGQL